MTECCHQTFGFQALGSRRVEADFSGGHLSSDGGVLLLRETDRHLGLCDKLARCFSDNPIHGTLREAVLHPKAVHFEP